MKLTPKEQEWLMVSTAAEVARYRKECGVPLNYLEAVAYIANWCIECGRDGQSVAEIRSGAPQLLGHEDVIDDIPEIIDIIQAEPMFPDGTKLVAAHDPIRSDSVGTVGSTADATTNGGSIDDTDTSGGDDA